MKGLGLLVWLLVITVPAPLFAALPYSGSWDVAVREFGDRNYYLPMTDGRMTLDDHGGRYSDAYNQLTFTDQLRSDGLHLACNNRGKACGTLVLEASANQLVGHGTLLGIAVTLSGRRPPQRPKGLSPQQHDYTPTQFHNFYSPFVTPVLHLYPGDSVRTQTLDSRGQDRDGKPRAPRGNPLTGPFYIEGAMPGDTLVVHLDRVRTNRDSAYQTNLIAANALETGYLQSLAGRESGFNAWKINPAAGTASLVHPNPALGGYMIKLSPMLGCIGVAPPRNEVLGSGHLGVFGGNMDSPEIREGVTLYLPVFQPGALLFVGDGHAEQGDGELPGQGLETSMDVAFTVDVLANSSLGQPRAENADFVMIMGTGVTLDAAMKNATTGMSRWLAGTYRLSPQDIAAFLGTAMRYQIAEVVDSEYDVVAKIPKAALAKIGK